MKALYLVFAFLCLPSLASSANAQNSVFFEERFDGPTLDPATWRTEIATSGARWCDSYPGAWQGPGTWVAEGEECYGVAADSLYGSAAISDGPLHISSTNGQACPYVVSRLPGSVALFPTSGDFTLRVRMRFDHITPWGTYLVVLQTPSTEPTGSNPVRLADNILLVIAGDGSQGFELYSALDGSFGPVAFASSGYQLRDFDLECIGASFTVRVDGEVVYGPSTSTLRPAAIFMGNQVLAYWYPTDWCWFSVDYIRVEVPEPVPVTQGTWGTLKAMFRGAGR